MDTLVASTLQSLLRLTTIRNAVITRVSRHHIKMSCLPTYTTILYATLIICSTLTVLSGAEDAGDVEAELTSMDSAASGVVPDPLEPVLTPYWSPLVFGAGETAVVDCGAYTGGQPRNVKMSWTAPQDKAIRGTVSRQDKHDPADTSDGAYSVLTLTLERLVTSDTGVYTCTVERTDGVTMATNFTLTVADPKTRCGFEDSLCGWTMDDNHAPWHVHNGSDVIIVERGKQGARFDHTYGSSKHIGHFLDVDPRHTDQKNTTARLTSPTYAANTEGSCLQFWYIFEGRDKGNLQVLLHRVGDPEDEVEDVDFTAEAGGPEWQRAAVNIEAQTKDFHIILEADSCRRKPCRLAAVSIDDISVTSGNCRFAPDWPQNDLKIRLVGGSSPREGRVEVLHDGQWGSICSEDFGDNEAKLICRTLGFHDSLEHATKCRDAHFGQSPPGSMIWLQRLACSKKERDLASCVIANETWGETECTHADDAGVICSAEPIECSETKISSETPSPSQISPQPTHPTVLTNATARATASATPGDAKSTPATAAAPPRSPSPSPSAAATPSTNITVPPVIPKSTTRPNATEAQPKQPITKSTTLAPQPTTTKDTAIKVPTVPVNGSTTTASTTTPSTTTTTSTTTTVPAPTVAPNSTTASKTSTKQTDTKTHPNINAPTPGTTPGVSTTKYVTPKTEPSSKAIPEKSSPTKRPESADKTNSDLVTTIPELDQYSPGNNAGVAIGIIFGLMIVTGGLVILLYRRKRKGKKSTYITFGNPSYSREHLPANDFSLESPLTLSSNGYTVLA